MKLEKQRKAKQLRLEGLSITHIASELGVSKGSVSRWVADVALSQNVLAEIKARSHSAAAVEARRSARLRRESERRATMRNMAAATISSCTAKELKYVGIALYWGEGSKKKRGVVEFTNSDPKMIQTMMNFFRKVCSVPEDKFRGHVYLHSHLDVQTAELYWSGVSGIPLEQFHKTSVQHNVKRLHKDSLPHGTFAIVICDTKLKLQLEGWTSGLADRSCV